jgi:arylformamidase
VDIARIVEECREAVGWLAREGPRYGVPARPLVVSGHSAGGHLTAMLVATDWRARGLPADTIAGAVALSGVFDLEPLVQSSINLDLKLDAAHAYLVSPIHLQPRVPTPMLIAAGADETSEFVRQSWLLWERWPECHPAGRRGPLFISGRHHFSVVTDLGHMASELVRQTLAFF